MRALFDLLPTAEGADLIRQCWGTVPPFAHGEVLHVKRRAVGGDNRALLLTGIFFTHGPEDANQCKPSRLVVEFARVVHWEYAPYPAEDAELDDVIHSPPSGTISIEVGCTFYIVCRGVRVLRCVHEPFGKGAD